MTVHVGNVHIWWLKACHLCAVPFEGAFKCNLFCGLLGEFLIRPPPKNNQPKKPHWLRYPEMKCLALFISFNIKLKPRNTMVLVMLTLRFSQLEERFGSRKKLGNPSWVTGWFSAAGPVSISNTGHFCLVQALNNTWLTHFVTFGRQSNHFYIILLKLLIFRSLSVNAVFVASVNLRLFWC